MRGPKRLERATQAALTSYVASTEQSPELAEHPSLAFAFCYLASHFGLDLLTEADIDAIMAHLVEHEAELRRRIARSGGDGRKRGRNRR